MNALEIKDLTKEYPGFKLGSLNLTLPRGCIMGLIGENGAGKSTTVKLILDMVRKDGGSITVLGKDNIEELSDIKEEVGVVLDDIGIHDCLNAVQVGKIMRETFKRWDESEYEKLLGRLSVPMDKPYKDYSRGMRMKLGIAIAMSHNPKLLILDEATSGLDPVVRDEVTDMFMEFTRDENHSVLISSHIVSDLEKICDYIAFLHKGKLILCDEKDALLEKYGILHCEKSRFDDLDMTAVLYKKETAYGVEALVSRAGVPAGFAVRPISIEELFIYMVKEEK